jgi:hypothetical protein
MRAAAVALVLAGAVAALALSVRDDEPPRTPAREAAVSGTAVSGTPPNAPVARCRDSITAAGPHDPLVVDDDTDNVAGPVRFVGLRTYDDWAGLVREDQWIKSIAMIDAGLRVTLEIPREQRDWMRLAYGGRGRSAVTLEACRRRTTAYAGGFTIEYAQAPEQGRCAELIVWADVALRHRLFDACRA